MTKLLAGTKEYQLEWLTRRRREWITANGPCQLCGSGKNLEVDHIDPSLKNPKAKRQNIFSWSRERLDEELKKCQVLCRSCHLEKSRKEITKTHCLRGHKFTPLNEYWSAGRRFCRTCVLARKAAERKVARARA